MGAGSTVASMVGRYPSHDYQPSKPILKKKPSGGHIHTCQNPSCQKKYHAIPADQDHWKLGKKIFCMECKPKTVNEDQKKEGVTDDK